MCGIVVSVGSSPQNSLLRGLNALSHRGPDGAGILKLDWVQLGHRRLSIIDVEGGHQPLANEDQTCFVTFNGEIYNYIELRQQLIRSGHIFATESDTEVIVHAYEEWGNRCVDHLRGMFAFAVADTRDRSVFIARDRMGIKPLLYCALGETTILASELPALVAMVESSLEINPAAIAAFLRLGYIPAPLSIYKGVKKLPAASWLRINANGQTETPTRYWGLNFSPDLNRTEDEWIDALDDTIRQSVKLHLRSDVHYGAFLSGGLDSSLVVSYMAELMDRPIQTFSLGFGEPGVSETQFAETAATICKTAHQTEVLDRNELDSIRDLVSSYGEPFGDHSAIPTMKLCKFASRHTKMALSGDGGDELFAGYERYLKAAPNWLYDTSRVKRGKEFIRKATNRIFHRKRQTSLSPQQHWNANARMFTYAEYQQLVDDPLPSDIADDLLVGNTSHLQSDHYLSQLQAFDIGTYLPGDILTKVDIASMKYGLEVRVPLLDHYVAEIAASIPPSLLISRDSTGKLQGKSLLKKLALRKYPHEFVYREKQGFGIPIAEWIGGLPRDELRSRLLHSASLLTTYVCPRAVEQLIDTRHVAMRSRKLWLLLILQEWLALQHRTSHPSAI